MVEAILQAAAETFARLGYARATTNKIARRAGVSVGSLYQYFPHKDSLLATLQERHRAEVDEVVHGALVRLGNPAVALEDTLRELLGGLVALHRANPALTRALSGSVLSQSAVAEFPHQGDSEEGRARAIGRLLAARPDVRHGDPTAMGAVLARTTSQLTRWLVHDAPSSLAQDALLEESVQLLLRFLRMP